MYCDFYSIENLSPMGDFLTALHREIDLCAEFSGRGEFETVFFGGGTPSLLAPLQLEKILSHLHDTFPITRDAEVTVETNPGTVTKEKLSAYRSLGVNRLSIGIQSFHEDELKFLSRIHDSAQAKECVRLAREVGFENVSIDLIYGLPGQTRKRWEQNLRTALHLNPQHISAYGLIVEDGTPLARMVQARLVSPMPADDEAELYECTMNFMEAHGFEHYEVSNYARSGFRSRHNYNYWRHGNYLGFGPSAHSFWSERGEKPRRWCNIANVSHYCRKLKMNELPIVTEEELSCDQLLTERIFLGLRCDGVNLDRLRNDFGDDFRATHSMIIDALLAAQALTFDAQSLRLTSKGYLVCDEICARLIA
ncbi:MAG: radical SAM family heme chaperone HemW [Ignavibacteriae bacterium]|nr:radical SAM family heme chaperone HemW [Ignavibacteriota bacterium]